MISVNQEELESFARRAAESPVLAIDTEFMREKTYYPKLCLLQMATEDEVIIVDPFLVDDLTVLKDVLESEHTVKLFHAGAQDIEILYRECGVVPHPVFDTQVAASLLGHTQQIGYGPLVGNLCGVTLKKLDSFTDWSKRPLSSSQMEYAANDVVYLPQMYAKLTEQLEKLGRLSWLDADFREMENPARYNEDIRERYKRLKRVNQLSRRQLSGARELAAWRERHAQACDIPRKWVITDEQIVEACKREARTIDELYMVRGMSEKLSTKDAREVVSSLKRGFDMPQDQWPKLDGPGRNEANVDIIVDAMSALVRLRARQNNIAFQMIASHTSLAHLARGHKNVDLLQGWRREIVGNDLVDLLEGRITLSIDSGNLIVSRATHKPNVPKR
ncbi:MAG: ribonuclease D [Eggerthellaceae bacterium]|nr:ribonuclease D [Eggerthellaceae bacterium]